MRPPAGVVGIGTRRAGALLPAFSRTRTAGALCIPARFPDVPFPTSNAIGRIPGGRAPRAPGGRRAAIPAAPVPRRPAGHRGRAPGRRAHVVAPQPRLPPLRELRERSLHPLRFVDPTAPQIDPGRLVEPSACRSAGLNPFMDRFFRLHTSNLRPRVAQPGAQEHDGGGTGTRPAAQAAGRPDPPDFADRAPDGPYWDQSRSTCCPVVAAGPPMPGWVAGTACMLFRSRWALPADSMT